MMGVMVVLPGLLAALIGSSRTIEVEAATVREALESVIRAYPALRVHFFDETGGLRRFVLCFVNGENSSWHGGLAMPLSPGDEVMIVQSVSGG